MPPAGNRALEASLYDRNRDQTQTACGVSKLRKAERYHGQWIKQSTQKKFKVDQINTKPQNKLRSVPKAKYNHKKRRNAEYGQRKR